MFKFFKDIFGAFKEGMKEAQDELDGKPSNKTQEIQIDNLDVASIAAIPPIEKFGTALAAPFRTVIFGDWFSLFDKQKDEDRYPRYLYEFGNYDTRLEKVEEFSDVLERDFDIVDKGSTIDVLQDFFAVADVDTNNIILSDQGNAENVTWDISGPGVDALWASVMAHIITASTDVEYLSKYEALPILEKVQKYIVPKYSSWAEYAQAFTQGEQFVGLNNAVGRKMLAKYQQYLLNKPGSPWNNILWQ